MSALKRNYVESDTKDDDVEVFCEKIQKLELDETASKEQKSISLEPSTESLKTNKKKNKGMLRAKSIRKYAVLFSSKSRYSKILEQLFQEPTSKTGISLEDECPECGQDTTTKEIAKKRRKCVGCLRFSCYDCGDLHYCADNDDLCEHKFLARDEKTNNMTLNDLDYKWVCFDCEFLFKLRRYCIECGYPWCSFSFIDEHDIAHKICSGCRSGKFKQTE
jgi:hypothetical protein